MKIHPVSSECRGVPIGLTFTQWMIWKPFMTKHRFPWQSHQRFPPFFDIILYRYCRLSMPNFLSSEHFYDKILKVKLDMKNFIWKLCLILHSVETVLTRKDLHAVEWYYWLIFAWHVRQALLGHDDTVYLFATEDNFYHSDDILQRILSFVCFWKGRISFWEDIRSTAHELRVFRNQSDC